MDISVTEILGAFQLRLITAAEARERLGFENIPAEDAPVPPEGAEGVFVHAAEDPGVNNG